MTRFTRLTLTGLLVLALAACTADTKGRKTPSPQAGPTSREQPADQDVEREVVAYASQRLAELAEAGEFSGVALLAKGDRVLFHRAYGLASRRYNAPNTVDTRFNLASAGKMFTAVAIARLVEEGQLSYDDPIAQYLSPLWVSSEVGEKVRIRHLLSHTSGLGHYWDGWDLYGNTIRELFDYKVLVSDELAFEPGSSWQYSNTGFLLLGVVIEKVTGKSYYDYVQEAVFDLAGMRDSGFFEIDEPHPNLATGYFMENGKVKNNLLLHGIRGSPAGGAWSTAADMHRFFLALLSDRLVSAETRELLWSPKPQSLHYGYGFQIEEEWIGHTGGFPGIGAVIAYYPRTGHMLVVLCNYQGRAFPLSDFTELLSALGED
jgi:CubicO group peptidase (beta-lactamase class C family)